MSKGENIGCGLLAIIALSGVGACMHKYEQSNHVTKLVPIESQLVQHPVDQVFRDHDGFRAMYADADGLVREVKYTEGDGYHTRVPCPDAALPPPLSGPCTPEQNLKVYKDLPTGERGFAASLKYTVKGWAVGERWNTDSVTYTEIHLPKDATLTPGNETYGGKYRTHEKMRDIK